MFTASVILHGCASTPKAVIGPGKDLSLQRLVTAGKKRTKASGAGSVVWKSKARNIGARGVLILDWPSRLRLEVQDPLGGMVAFLVIAEDEFWSYREEAGIAWRGSIGASESKRLLPIPMSGEDYLRVLLARPPVEAAQVKYVSNQSNSAQLTYAEFPERVDYLEWDLANEEPVRWILEWKDTRKVEVFYSDYRPVAGTRFPGKISILYSVGDIERLQLIWRWSDLEAYLPKVGDLFTIPPSWGEAIRTRTLK